MNSKIFKNYFKYLTDNKEVPPKNNSNLCYLIKLFSHFLNQHPLIGFKAKRFNFRLDIKNEIFFSHFSYVDIHRWCQTLQSCHHKMSESHL